jgi:hypothetical protein
MKDTKIHEPPKFKTEKKGKRERGKFNTVDVSKTNSSDLQDVESDGQTRDSCKLLISRIKDLEEAE